MKYTFLLPAYKKAFLEESIRSILNQTYTDFKLIISDDCSPEDIYSVVKIFKEDKRLFYRRNNKNIGGTSLVAHWNLMLDLCDTEYFILASDDDVYTPDFLEKMNELIEKYPSVNLFHSRAQCINENGEVFKIDSLYKEFVTQLEYLEQLDYYNHIECIANYVFRTESLKKIGGFVNFPLAWSSDTATCNLMAENGVVNTSAVYFCFRMSGLNISSQPVGDKRMSRLKFKAFCEYDKLMQDVLKGIKPGDSLLEMTTYNRVCENHKKRMSGLIAWQSVNLPLPEFLSYINQYKKIGYIDSLFITIKKWLVAKLK